MPWLDIYHYSTPRDRPIKVRLSDGSECVASYNPLAQEWQDEEGKRVVPVEWESVE